jgi:uncharacterized membrane protein
MQRWLILALVAAVFWGGNAVLVKLTVGKEHLGLEGSRANLFVALGILAAMFIYDRLNPLPFSSGQLPAYALAFAVGVIWALGNIFAFSAVRAGGTMSQIVPIYNTNTLVAVLLCMLLLREIPVGLDMYRVIAGAVLITIGAILVS